MSDAIDQPMTPTEKKQLWRTATFHCRCGNDKIRYHALGIRTFCRTCSLLIFIIPTSMPNTCPGCTIQCSWKEQGHPCLACQLATIVYRNPFHQRYSTQLQQWLCQGDTDDSADNLERPTPARHLHNPPTNTDLHILRMRNLNFENSFQEIRNRATPEQRQHLFENLSILQNSIKTIQNGLKRRYEPSSGVESSTTHPDASLPSQPQHRTFPNNDKTDTAPPSTPKTHISLSRNPNPLPQPHMRAPLSNIPLSRWPHTSPAPHTTYNKNSTAKANRTLRAKAKRLLTRQAPPTRRRSQRRLGKVPMGYAALRVPLQACRRPPDLCLTSP
ncbi:MAG: hypothetical protein ACK51L_02765 [bacterium]